MNSFSQRKRLKPQKIVQVDTIDEELRHQLWSALHDNVFAFKYEEDDRWRNPTGRARLAASFGRKFWTGFLKRPSDERPSLENIGNPAKNVILSDPWNVVYDAMEFTLAELPPVAADPLENRWNNLLKQENAGYRLLNKHVVDITSEAETAEIETSLTSQIAPVREHIDAALTFLTDRKNPDYRNSIKESISAVESASRLIGGGKTLRMRLSRLGRKLDYIRLLRKGSAHSMATRVIREEFGTRYWNKPALMQPTHGLCSLPVQPS